MDINSQNKPLVIGAPRSGFTLLINVIDALLQAIHRSKTLNEKILNASISSLGTIIGLTIKNAFAEKGVKNNLIFSPSFWPALGGPHWIDQEEKGFFCIRKYIGVKGLGDFTFLIRFPVETTSFFPVEHSHYNPITWLSDPRFSNCQFFASVRNPIDILNSSCFSINAQTSEYIQKFVKPKKDNDELRKHLALYKLTDLNFFEGLIKSLMTFFTEYLKYRKHFYEMRWENLIGIPGETIIKVAEQLGLLIDTEYAADIWHQIAYRNLTGAHQHNYRKGNAFVNGWRRSLTNEHLQFIKESGLENICIELGYGKIPEIAISEYTNYQKKVASFLKKGKVFRRYLDKDLFIFAFNKSNINISKFQKFKHYEWKTYSRIERSCFNNESILFYVWDAVEKVAFAFNKILKEIIKSEFSKEQYNMELKKIFDRYPLLLKNTGFNNSKECIDTIGASIAESDNTPRLIQSVGEINLVRYRNIFYGIPQSLGPINLMTDNLDRYNNIICKAPSLHELRNILLKEN